MISRKEQLRYYDDRWKSIRRELGKFPGRREPESLHRLRVEIKKLKALILLVPEAERPSRDFRLVKKIFRKAGSIRQAQLNLGLAKKFQAGTAVQNKLKQQIREGEIVFSGKIPAWLRKLRKTEKTFRRDFQKRSTKEVSKIVQAELDFIQDIFVRSVKEELHFARKHIKILLYLYSVCGKKEKSRLGLDHSYLDRLQELLGEWHDHETLLSFLAENKTGHNVLAKAKRRAAVLLDKVLNQAGDFPAKARRLKSG